MINFYMLSHLWDSISVILWTTKSFKGVLFMDIRYVRGHIEVYDLGGTFMFSADTMGEVEELLED